MNLIRNKKLVIIFIVILLILITILFYHFFTKKKIQEENTFFVDPIATTPYQITKINALSKKIDECNNQECQDTIKRIESVLGSNLKECIHIVDITKRDNCIIGIAKQRTKEKDAINLCSRIAIHSNKIECLSILSIYRPNSLENNISEMFSDEPFEQKEFKDRTLAFQATRMAQSSENNTEAIGAINMCRSDLALEYGPLCLKGTLKFINYNCDLLDAGFKKDFCISQKIFNEKDIRTIEDCNNMPLMNYRKVCLREIETGISRFKMDSDNDGKSDMGELNYTSDPFNPDTDGDGLLDGEETEKYHSNPLDPDTDGDGLSDYDEIQKGTSIQKPDTDNDGILDGEDDDPLNKTNDNDEDRLSNEEEEKWGTNPNKKDTDGDGISDWEEIRNCTNPLGGGWQHDTDGDGLIDIDERFYLTDPLNPDTDGDGVNDAKEIKKFTNPLGDGDMDFDGDGLSDKEELKYGTNPSIKDTDGDGISDADEVKLGANPLK